MIRILLVFVLAVLVIACAVREERPAGAWLEEREQHFAEYPDWTVRGRLALSDGQRGGSLGFEWSAEGDNHQIHLRTMTGGRQWRLDFGPGYALLEGTEIDQMVGSDPDPLVEAAVGWPIPVSLMADWIRGLPAPADARLRFASDGSLAGLDHAVWTLDYQRLREENGILMPRRIEANSADYRVRLVLADWSFQH